MLSGPTETITREFSLSLFSRAFTETFRYDFESFPSDVQITSDQAGTLYVASSSGILFDQIIDRVPLRVNVNFVSLRGETSTWTSLTQVPEPPGATLLFIAAIVLFTRKFFAIPYPDRLSGQGVKSVPR